MSLLYIHRKRQLIKLITAILVKGSFVPYYFQIGPVHFNEDF